MRVSFPAAAALTVAAALAATSAEAQGSNDWSGYVAAEGRSFLESPAQAGQDSGVQLSLVAEPELYRQLARDGESFTAKLFVRLDSLDSERTHFDVRELAWSKAGDGWDLTVGVSKVFWGVTESQHLVDVVNQTDLVENLDGEDKLGQPMVKLSLTRSWGILDFFVLPGFRERTFPGEEGRLRFGLPVDTDRPIYESSAEDGHVDAAIRWSHVLGPFDVGLSHFHGTSRDPRFVLEEGLIPSLRPLYEQIDQSGLDAQATLGSWLLKAEGIRRSGQGETFLAATGGFEYTFYGLGNTALDLGVIGEYLWDERGDEALTPFEDDVFLGARLAFNDVQSSEILAGLVRDLSDDSSFYLVEASRRLGTSWKIEAELRIFSELPAAGLFSPLAPDDHLALSLQRHF